MIAGLAPVSANALFWVLHMARMMPSNMIVDIMGNWGFLAVSRDNDEDFLPSDRWLQLNR